MKMSLTQSGFGMKLAHGSTHQWSASMKEALSRWVWHSQGLEWSLPMAVHTNGHQVWRKHCQDEFDTVRVWNEACPWQHTPMVTKYEGSTVKMSLTQSGFGMKLAHGSTHQWSPSMKEALSRWVWHSQGLEWSLPMAAHTNGHQVWRKHCQDEFDTVRVWNEACPWQYTPMVTKYEGSTVKMSLTQTQSGFGMNQVWRKHCQDKFDPVRVWNEACPWQYTPMVTKYEGSTVKISLTQSGFGMKLVHGSTQQCTPSMKEALSRWLWHNIYLCNNAHDIWQTLHCHNRFMVRVWVRQVNHSVRHTENRLGKHYFLLPSRILLYFSLSGASQSSNETVAVFGQYQLL